MIIKKLTNLNIYTYNLHLLCICFVYISKIMRPILFTNNPDHNIWHKLQEIQHYFHRNIDLLNTIKQLLFMHCELLMGHRMKVDSNGRYIFKSWIIIPLYWFHFKILQRASIWLCFRLLPVIAEYWLLCYQEKSEIFINEKK